MTHFKVSRGFTSFHKLASRQKPEKQHATMDQSYPANVVTLTGDQCYPMRRSKLPPNTFRKSDLERLIKVSVKFIFLSIKFAFNFLIYLFLVYRMLLTYSKATVGTLEQS